MRCSKNIFLCPPTAERLLHDCLWLCVLSNCADMGGGNSPFHQRWLNICNLVLSDLLYAAFRGFIAPCNHHTLQDKQSWRLTWHVPCPTHRRWWRSGCEVDFLSSAGQTPQGGTSQFSSSCLNLLSLTSATVCCLLLHILCLPRGDPENRLLADRCWQQ